MEEVVVGGEAGAELSEAFKKLSGEELKVVIGLLEGKSLKAAGACAGKCKRTVQNWMGRPNVRAALREGREMQLKAASTYLQGQTSWAARQLRALVLDKEAGGFARVAAARAILELAVKAALADDQTDQIAEIREELAGIREAAAERNGSS